jgi:hypothetical protein
MIHNENERRKYNRIHGTDLPDIVKNLSIDIGTGELFTAKTLDMSIKGMGLSAPVSTKDITSIFIKVSTTNKEVSIKEQILSTRSLTDSISRISIMFRKENPFFALV